MTKVMYLTEMIQAGGSIISPELVEVIESPYNGAYYVLFTNAHSHFILKKYFIEPLPVLMELF